MYIIPVTPFTLDLIQSLNGEVRPQIEREATHFVFRPHGHNFIITEEQFKNLTDDRTAVTISYVPG